ncbi:MAG: putative hydratase/decarboxylase [Rhodospirillales bacterium]|jgi:2-oxo-3-hexenedioate decarboxylase/2-keto-4-pentenoate hydratase|nr:putative hydratase/decarboxylase [Rhodospirillales bacterium]
MDADALDRAAVMIADTRAAVGRLAPLPAGLSPRDEAEGYAVQDRLRLHLAGRGLGGLAGFKIGCTTQVMQKYLGIDHPCAGAMSSGRIYASGSQFPAAAFVRPGVECEIAVEIARDLTPADAPFDRVSLSDAIAAVFAAIEIVDDRYENWRAMDLATLVADDFFHAGLVLGPRVADWQGWISHACAGPCGWTVLRSAMAAARTFSAIRWKHLHGSPIIVPRAGWGYMPAISSRLEA